MSDYTFKNHKQIEIIKEMIKVGSRYEINGVNSSLAYYMYRNPQELFQVIPPGSYTITQEGGNTYLDISDAVILSTALEFQVIYVYDVKSSQYIDPFPDLVILQNKYNELQDDFSKLVAVLNSNNISADTLKMMCVLPVLNTNEVWVKTDDGYRGFDIGELEQNIADQIKEFEKLVADSLQALEDKGDEIENNIIGQGTTQVDRIDSQASQVNNSLDAMWRMFSITTGSNRYASGNNIENRDNTQLDKELIGGDITQRNGKPRKVYYGGNIADRKMVNALNIDLGSSRG